MSAVMMIPINVAITRAPGKGQRVRDRLVQTEAVAPPVMTEAVLNVMTVVVAHRVTIEAVHHAKILAVRVIHRRTVSRAPGDETPEKPDHGGISGKSFIDPEVLRRQRAEETRVYGENACRALFSSRPDSIVRARFVQRA